MTTTSRPTIKPTHKPLKTYYATLQNLGSLYVSHELALRTAFQTLLESTAKPFNWTLVPEQRIKVNSHSVVPDATLRDQFNNRRGFWEAKDSSDDLDNEIARKIQKKYPLSNTIFEDTQSAVLFQGGREVFRIDLKDPQKLATLLNHFFSYTEPVIEKFDHAIVEFKDRVPDIALALKKIIDDAHKDNPRFIAAFASFLALCQSSLNPNLNPAAVDEMLIQHLLTERLIRNIFDYENFARRNVIAAEVETVIDALTSKSFSKHEFLRSLDPFYSAIESAAKTLDDFSEKQHFLNTIYERFFQGYSVKTADTHGIVYTPQEIVDFMCASVVQVLKTEFNKSIGDKDVFIIDPCTGTGNFIVNLLRRIPKQDLQRVYQHQLFANEIMLLPYYIAALNIEHAYNELTGSYESFEGLCFVDTLDLAEHRQAQLSFMTAANTARVERQKKTPITVVIGNPPYNMAQQSENDNNKNRRYPVVEQRIRETYIRASSATNVNKLNDPYVKFFRWATDRLGNRDGIVCFVSNNGFLDQRAFDGMRRRLSEEFTQIYHINLHGNVRENTKLSGTTHNVFGIQVGVGITLAVRAQKHKSPQLRCCKVPEMWRRGQKLAWLAERQQLSGMQWETVTPDAEHSWVLPDNAAQFAPLVPLGSKSAKSSASDAEAIFKYYSIGVVTNRDDVVYDFDKSLLAARVTEFIEDYNGEVFRYQRSGAGKDVDSFVHYDKIKWSRDLKRDLKHGHFAEFSESKLRHATYRPFCQKYLFFDKILNQDTTRWPTYLPSAVAHPANTILVVGGYGRKPFSVLATQAISDLNFYADPAQCSPFYTYDSDGSNRRENITDFALKSFQSHYQDPAISKWDIFHYVYALLHHPQYRSKFADNLKRSLPRIPFAPATPHADTPTPRHSDTPASPFHSFASAGQQLAALHLNYESLPPHPLQYQTSPTLPLSYRVEKMKLSKDKTRLIVNPSLTLAPIPPETFTYRLGNRSALDWIIDQYQVTTDKRSGITSDPNRPDDPQYITRLAAQIIHLSLQTMKIVNSLPPLFPSQ